MHDAGLLQPLFDGPADIGRLTKLVDIEETLGRGPDPVLRLAALAADTPADAARLRDKLRLSSSEAVHLCQAAARDGAFDPSAAETAAKEFLYRHGVDAFTDGALMDWVRSGAVPDDAARAGRLALPERWPVPELPVRGADLLALGVPAGPEVGKLIAAFERWWIDAGYPADKSKAAEKLRELVRGLKS